MSQLAVPRMMPNMCFSGNQCLSKPVKLRSNTCPRYLHFDMDGIKSEGFMFQAIFPIVKRDLAD